MREERGDDRSISALDQKARDLSSRHGSSNGPSPVLNLSKSGHGADQASLDEDARSEHSEEINSTAASIRDDEEENHSDVASDVDDRMADKDDGKSRIMIYLPVVQEVSAEEINPEESRRVG